MTNKKLGINVGWIKHIKSEADQQSFVDALSNNPIAAQLKAIISDRLKERVTFKEEDYCNPSWAYSAADRNGYVRAMNEVLNLLTIKER
jgi:hypothetical protein